MAPFLFPLMLFVSTGLVLFAPAPVAHGSGHPCFFVSGLDTDKQADEPLHAPLPSGGPGAAPRDTVEGLSARANDWTEPSRSSESMYVQAVRVWLNGLAPGPRAIARRIMRDAHPILSGLREAIRGKKAELAAISFSRDMRPEALPLLGVELQKLRAALHAELDLLKLRLAREAGVDMGALGRDTFWLSLPDNPNR